MRVIWFDKISGIDLGGSFDLTSRSDTFKKISLQKSSPQLSIHTKTKSLKMYTLDAVDSFHISDPANTYIYDIVPIADGFATISSDDCLRLLNPLALNGQPINSIRRVNTDVTCLKALDVGGAVVVTAGRDGRVCLVDLRTGAKVGEVRSGE